MRLLLHPAMLATCFVWITMLCWMAAQIFRAPEGVQDEQGFHVIGRRRGLMDFLRGDSSVGVPRHN